MARKKFQNPKKNKTMTEKSVARQIVNPAIERERQLLQKQIARDRNHPELAARVSHCARLYWKARTNPRDGDELACVPSMDSVKTERTRVRSLGTFHTGTLAANNSTGSVVVDPLNARANNAGCVMQTTTAYAGNTVADLSSAGTTSNTSNSQYDIADFGPANDAAKSRIVAAELRIWYTGTELNCGGIITLLHNPNHDTIVGLTQSEMADNDMYRRFNIESRKVYTVLYSPAGNQDLDLNSPGFATSPIPNTSDRFFMGALVTAASDNAAFSYEFTVIYEAAGSFVRDAVTSHSDPNALAAAAFASESLYPSDKLPGTIESEFVKRATSYLLNGISTVIQIVSSGRRIVQAASFASNVIF